MDDNARFEAWRKRLADAREADMLHECQERDAVVTAEAIAVLSAMAKIGL
jgi:hypothetical protein